MGAAIDTVVGTVTAPGAAITATAAATGDSFAVRNTNPGVGIWLLNMWALNNVAGVMRVRSPRLHDNVQGIRSQVIASVPLPLLAHYPVQRLYPQDVLTVELSGSGVGGNIESAILAIYYEDVPGLAGTFISPDALQQRGVNVVTVEVDVAPGVGGGYTGASALNKTVDVLKANTSYALLGGTLSATTGAVTIKGVDSGNLRQAIPGLSTMPQLTKDWFWRLSEWSRLPLIPVYNSANKAGITIEGVASQAGTAFNVSLNFVELAGPGAPAPVVPAGALSAR
jgi:hypothetical protein